MRILSFFLAFLALCSNMPFSWASQTARRSDQISARRALAVLQTSFDEKESSLPPHFAGHDAAALVDAIDGRRNSLQKREFETAAEHDARVKTTQTTPLLGSLDYGSTYAFVLPQTTTLYDADRQTLAVTVPHSLRYLLDEPIYSDWAFMWRRSVEERSKYAASNVFGATFGVEKLLAIDHVVGVDGTSLRQLIGGTFNEYEHNIPLTLTVPLQIEEAKTAKPNIRVLLICTLREPYTAYGILSREPTFSMRVDAFELQINVLVKAVDIWVFNNETGSILWKVSNSKRP